MVILAAIGIVVVVAIVIGYPLFRNVGGEDISSEVYGEDHFGELLSRKESLYSTIKELDFDFKTAKLSLEDYKELKEKYEGEALSLLKDIDESRKGRGDIDSIIEKEVLFRREVPSSSRRIDKMGKPDDLDTLDTNVEKDILARRKSLSLCPDCGARCRKEAIFCSNCGRKLK